MPFQKAMSGDNNSIKGTSLLPSDQYKGWLYKWTNYIRGYQKRWFVLQNGLLGYYLTTGS